MENVIVRQLRNNEEKFVSDIAKSVFMDSVAPYCKSYGVSKFLDYVRPEKIKERFSNNHIVFVAENKITRRIIGMIEVKNFSHISMFFVEKPYQDKHVGRKLIFNFISYCRKNVCEVKRLTADVPPNSVKKYEKMGFWKAGKQTEQNGIRFTPMVLVII
ncbi:MAG: GNAT family N-acetyltransferase [Endomicrobiales bacterium]|nr:GNAT family N-acetyltransferase [Endomicrobiales bacterium]